MLMLACDHIDPPNSWGVGGQAVPDEPVQSTFSGSRREVAG